MIHTLLMRPDGSADDLDWQRTENRNDFMAFYTAERRHGILKFVNEVALRQSILALNIPTMSVEKIKYSKTRVT